MKRIEFKTNAFELSRRVFFFFFFFGQQDSYLNDSREHLRNLDYDRSYETSADEITAFAWSKTERERERTKGAVQWIIGGKLQPIMKHCDSVVKRLACDRWIDGEGRR